jgi:hypothetical protein
MSQFYNLEFGNTQFSQGIGESEFEGGIGNDSICNLDYKKGVLAPPIRLSDFLLANAPRSATYTWAGNVVTVTLSSHGLLAGQVVYIDFTSGQGTPDGNYTLLASPGTNDFTFTLTGSGTGGNCTVKKVIPYMRTIAFANDSNQAVNGALCLGSEYGSEDGQLYSMDKDFGGASLSLIGVKDTTRNYKLGYSDAIFYNGNYYITSITNIIKVNAAKTSVQYDWWTATVGGGGVEQSALTATVAHQMVIAYGYLYIIDGNKVHRIDSSDNVINGILELDTDFSLMAIEYHNNKIYLYADKVKNNLVDASSSDAVFASKGEIIIWDGTNIDTSTIERYPVSSPIFTMKSFNGNLYIWDAYSFGYWNGMTIQSLRKTNGFPKYKCMITYYKDRLYWIDGSEGDTYLSTNNRVICFNGKLFYHCIGTGALSGGKFIDAIFRWKGSALALFANNSDENSSDGYTLGFNTLMTVTSSTTVAYSQWYNLTTISYIRKCLLELADVLVSGSEMTIAVINQKGEEKTLMTISYTADGAVRYKEVGSLVDLFTSFRFKIYFTTSGRPIKRILLTLETASSPA